MKKEQNYQSAYEELSTIVEEIENENIPLDKLAEKIKRAGVLITFCQQKLRQTEEEFKAAINDLKI